MIVANLLREACPDYGEMARKAGLSAGYVRHLAKTSNPRSAGFEARHKLAKAFRDHAADLLRTADELEKG